MRSSLMGSSISSPFYENCTESCEWTTAARGVHRRWGVEKLSYYSSVNGWDDCIEIWYALGTHSVRCIQYSHRWGVSARAHVHTPSLPLRNGSADRVQICCVIGSPLVKRFSTCHGSHSHCGLHVRTCTPHLCISETA